MSIRTVIEINHDFLGDMTQGTFSELVLLLKSGDAAREMNHRPELRGIKFLAQRHHSTKMTITVE